MSGELEKDSDLASRPTDEELAAFKRECEEENPARLSRREQKLSERIDRDPKSESTELMKLKLIASFVEAIVAKPPTAYSVESLDQLFSVLRDMTGRGDKNQIGQRAAQFMHDVMDPCGYDPSSVHPECFRNFSITKLAEFYPWQPFLDRER